MGMRDGRFAVETGDDWKSGGAVAKACRPVFFFPDGTVGTSVRYSIGAVVRPVISCVIGATKTVVVKAAAGEMTPSAVKVTSAPACDMASAETSHVASHVTAAKTAHVTSAEAAHVASAAAHVAAASAAAVASAATAGLRAGGKKAAGKHCTCQDHHHSSSHDILQFIGRDCPPQGRCWRVREDANVAMHWRWGGVSVVPIKFRFIKGC